MSEKTYIHPIFALLFLMLLSIVAVVSVAHATETQGSIEVGAKAGKMQKAVAKVYNAEAIKDLVPSRIQVQIPLVALCHDEEWFFQAVRLEDPRADRCLQAAIKKLTSQQ